MKKLTKNRKKGAVILRVLFGLFFIILIGRFLYLEIIGIANGKPLAAQAAQQYLQKETLFSQRGNILDTNGEVIAENVVSYSMVAVVTPSVTIDKDNPQHVVDRVKTAKVLSKYIDMTEADILTTLNKIEDNPKLYQVEFGTAGKNISSATKMALEKEKLPGIIFTKTNKRIYPNGIFASNLVGIVKDEEVKVDDSYKTIQTGQMGIEASEEKELNGKDGSINYSQDNLGLILPNADKVLKKAENGNTLTLTLNKRIQTLLEERMSAAQAKYTPEEMMAVVMNPKTGEIVAMSQRPTFNAQTREGLDKSWRNLVAEEPFEPGSVMKIFTLATAIQKGVYNPNALYKSGSYSVDDIKINDWNNGEGWGTISFNEGVAISSNVAFANLLDKIGTSNFKASLEKFGLGKSTDSGLANEASGDILYRYPIERVTTSFGQGTTVTAMQMMQGVSAIANDGKMMKPYYIKAVKDGVTGKVTTTKPTQVGTPVSNETANETLEQLRSVIEAKDGTGSMYKLDGYKLAGKTGTAQIANNDGSGYMTGPNDYIYSFMGIAPTDDPQLVMYVTVKKPVIQEGQSSTDVIKSIFNPVMQTSLQYLNIKPEKKISAQSVVMPELTDQTITQAQKALKESKASVTVVGDGAKIVQQLPQKGEEILEKQRVILLTNGNITMPDMANWSKNDALKFSEISGVPLTFNGSGYVAKQSVKAGEKVSAKTKITLEMKAAETLEKYNVKPTTTADEETTAGTERTAVNEAVGTIVGQ